MRNEGCRFDRQIPVLKHRKSTEIGKQMVQIIVKVGAQSFDRDVCIQADFRDVKLCSNLCFPPSSLWVILAASCWRWYSSSSSNANAMSKLSSSTSSSSLWQFIESGREFLLILGQILKFVHFENSAGLLYFYMILFPPIHKIQFLYNYIIHNVSLLCLSANCWD